MPTATSTTPRPLDPGQLSGWVGAAWRDRILPALTEYIRIPNESPAFDADWERHGHMERAVQHVATWCRAELRRLPGAQLHIERLAGRTPLIIIDVPGRPDAAAAGAPTVLLYGHLDKQPPLGGWAEGLGPWTPVLRGERLYGRGGADDGYAAFASVTALAALAEAGQPYAHCVILIEACEESGSVDLPAHIEALGPRLGAPDLVICLDSGCGNYDQLWGTTSLRGLVTGTLTVETLREGVHSGDASGIVPSSFRIASQLLSRLEDGPSGVVSVPELQAEIPAERRQQAAAAVAELGVAVTGKYPFLPGVQPVGGAAAELVLNRTWRPALAVTGQAGLPPLQTAGNVMLPRTQLQLSMRLPPTCSGSEAAAAMKRVLERDPPYGARVRFEAHEPCTGWNAPPLATWLGRAVDEASRQSFGRPACWMGEGGSIPFMGMLGRRFPQAQFLITGVLGPESNAHGPNEFLHLPTAERLTTCVAQVLLAHQRRSQTS
ncbi:MAG: M20/M25/M40 family metallo-hydrolase [Planctomycetota bacterium]